MIRTTIGWCISIVTVIWNPTHATKHHENLRALIKVVNVMLTNTKRLSDPKMVIHRYKHSVTYGPEFVINDHRYMRAPFSLNVRNDGLESNGDYGAFGSASLEPTLFFPSYPQPPFAGSSPRPCEVVWFSSCPYAV